MSIDLREPTITCPNCGTVIKVDKSLAAPIMEAAERDLEQKVSQHTAVIEQQEEELRLQRQELAKAQASVAEQVAIQVLAIRETVVVEEVAKARASVASDLEQKNQNIAALRELIASREAKLAEAQGEQAELIRKQRELDDAMREIEVTIERRVTESIASVRDKAKLEAEETLKLKVLEREETISSMQRQIEDLRRRAAQGSQQLQGEVVELELEGVLRTRFPTDVVEPVAKGEFGGDVLQYVVGPLGQQVGSILWESKRTKNWSDGWLQKLRADQRAARADIAILVTATLPKGVESFDLVDGVWISDGRSSLSLAVALRQSLLQTAGARTASEGQQTKMELVYQYLTSPKFRHRIEAIVEHFSNMQDDLDRERKAMTRLWAKRQSQINSVIEATVGMYGDLQGIAGRALPEIAGLELLLLDTPDDAAKEPPV